MRLRSADRAIRPYPDGVFNANRIEALGALDDFCCSLSLLAGIMTDHTADGEEIAG
jgi:hypothetical protein